MGCARCDCDLFVTRSRTQNQEKLKPNAEEQMVNVRCQACQAKYRLLAAKRVNLLGLVLEARPINRKHGEDKSDLDGKSGSYHLGSYKPTPRFPYRPPIQRRPRSYILPPGQRVFLYHLENPTNALLSAISIYFIKKKGGNG